MLTRVSISPAREEVTKVAFSGVLVQELTLAKDSDNSPSSAIAMITRGTGYRQPSKLTWGEGCTKI